MIPVRHTARALLINDEKKLLLMKVQFNHLKTPKGFLFNAPYWITLGGKIEEGETVNHAAIREIYEETGISDLELGPVVWVEKYHLIFNDIWTEYNNTYIVIKAKKSAFSFKNFTALEKQYVKDMRWFSYEEIINSEELIHPIHSSLFKQHLPDILIGNYPSSPLNFDLSKEIA